MRWETHERATSGIADVFSIAVSPKAPPAKRKTAPPFSLRLSAEERARLNAQAGSQPLGSYIRSCLFGEHADKRRRIRRPGPDHKKLALVLAELGRSRLASNMNQLAKAANMGALDFSESVVADLREACRAIAQMRDLLIAALGVMPEEE